MQTPAPCCTGAWCSLNGGLQSWCWQCSLLISCEEPLDVFAVLELIKVIFFLMPCFIASWEIDFTFNWEPIGRECHWEHCCREPLGMCPFSCSVDVCGEISGLLFPGTLSVSSYGHLHVASNPTQAMLVVYQWEATVGIVSASIIPFSYLLGRRWC